MAVQNLKRRNLLPHLNVHIQEIPVDYQEVSQIVPNLWKEKNPQVQYIKNYVLKWHEIFNLTMSNFLFPHLCSNIVNTDFKFCLIKYAH